MLTITTYDWVPKFPRGYVRDIRARWACEEAGLPYAIDTVPARDKTPAHLARQPFHQVPMLQDGDLSLFESGAIVLHIAEKSDALMPRDPMARAQVIQWLFAAVNSVEPSVGNWILPRKFDKNPEAEATAAKRLHARLGQLSDMLKDRDWLVGGRFTAADLMMADALRVPQGEGILAEHPALEAYVARATARPAFQKAYADQIAHFAAADAAQGAAS